jgi:protein ImuA
MPGHCIDTGFAQLSSQLPGGGWPLGNVIELLAQQPGTGEARLLRPALSGLTPPSIFLVQPPYVPQIAAWANAQCAVDSILWAQPQSMADALWATEQILRSNAFGAVLLWQNVLRGPSLRRLQLAAGESNTLCVLVRPLNAANQPSAAPLRLALYPTLRGLAVSILKRRGATHNGLVHVDFYPDTALSRTTPSETVPPEITASETALPETGPHRTKHEHMDRGAPTPHSHASPQPAAMR